MFKLQRILIIMMMILSMIQKPNRGARFIVVHASSFVSTRRSTRLSKQQQHHKSRQIHDSKLVFGISTTTSSKKIFVTNTNFRQQQQSVSPIQRLFVSSSSTSSQNDTTTTTTTNITTEKNPISKENNTLFQGMTHATSKYVTHYLAPDGNTTTVQDAIQSVIPSSSSSPSSFSTPISKKEEEEQQYHDLLSSSSPLLENMTLSAETSLPIWRFDPAYLPQKDGDDAVQLTAKELLALGSIWFIPASSLPSDDATSTNVNRKKDDTVKPTRLTVEDANKILHKGDYLRIHHHPRRFQVVNRYNWAKPIYSKEEEEGKKERNNSGINNDLPGLIVAENSKAGYIILNKPCGVPVHSTVDNVLECVSGAVGRMLLQRKIRMMNHPNVNQNETLSSAKEQQHDEDETKQKKNHQRKKKPEPLVYIGTPQRLDISTSGLLVVATHKRFAAYFAQLLRMKTDKQLSILGKENNNNDDYSDEGEKITKVEVPCGVHKRYKCLVCLCPGKTGNDDDTKVTSRPQSMMDELDRLRSYVSPSTSIIESNNGLNYDERIMRHYLENSVYAQKNFRKTLPDLNTTTSSSTKSSFSPWLECLLRVTSVGNPCTVIGSKPSDKLAVNLWGDKVFVPDECVAVVEVEVELLTGRTHQIRGQLSAEGFPLVGDATYGGAAAFIPPNSDIEMNENERKLSSMWMSRDERLALHCCELEFIDPDLVVQKTRANRRDIVKEQEVAVKSDRWNKFQLDKAWWTPHIDQFAEENMEGNDSATSSISDEMHARILRGDGVSSDAAVQTNQKEGERNVLSDNENKKLLPKRVALSPGIHKYVLIEARERRKKDNASEPAELPPQKKHKSAAKPIRFVRSASPSECGGPYHANVASSLVEELTNLGYDVTVAGGGRIDYNEYAPHAHVYGFSYGFGKGDHELVAKIIEKYGDDDVVATFDNSNNLY